MLCELFWFVLCGVVWCFVVWCGVVWWCVVWCGVVSCGVACLKLCDGLCHPARFLNAAVRLLEQKVWLDGCAAFDATGGVHGGDMQPGESYRDSTKAFMTIVLAEQHRIRRNIVKSKYKCLCAQHMHNVCVCSCV